MTSLGQSVTLTLGDLRPKLPSALSGSQSMFIDPPWREKHDGSEISALSQIANKLLTKNYCPGNGIFFSLTWPGRSTVKVNGYIRTAFDEERAKLSAGPCCEALSQSGATCLGGGGGADDGEKEVQTIVNMSVIVVGIGAP